MKTLDLIDSFSEFKEFKNIDRETLMHILEEVFRAALAKRYGTEDNFDIIVNIDKGDLEIFRNRTIVEDGAVKDENLEIAYSDAIKIESDFEVGEELSEPIYMTDFGRREILAIRQNLVSKIQDYEKSLVFQKYKEKVGEIVVGEVYQPWNKEILILDEEKIELVLPKAEQIPTDRFRKGDTVRAVVLKVEMRNNNPVIVLSRTSPIFLERLLEAEVPEIYDGLITIHGIVRELRNENIDVLNYTPRLDIMVQRALAPAKVSSLKVREEEKKVDVYMEPDQVSLAIGKGGCNIKLASKLVGYDIDVYRTGDEDPDDVDLRDFSDEIDQWIIDILINIGCDTAREVLALSKEDLLSRTDLEEETIDEVIRILKAEFEEEPNSQNAEAKAEPDGE